jgi:hypothetical protein
MPFSPAGPLCRSLLHNGPGFSLCEQTVCTENSNPDVMMVKPAEDRV